MSNKNEKPKTEKKPKKERKEGETAKKREKQPWKVRQLDRLAKAIKSVTKLAASITSAKPPAVSETFAPGALANLNSLNEQVIALAADWKPAKGVTAVGTSKKIGVGSIVMVRTDLDRTESKTYKLIPVTLYDNAVVLDGDGRYWLVKCADGTTRMLIKKHAMIVGSTPTTPAPAATA